MCKFKSAIILKDRVFIPDYDSHSEMLDELKIEDTRANAERLFIRAELYPKDNAVFSDVDAWIFNVDQDIHPEWYVEEVDKARMITAVKEWAKNHIYVGVDGLKLEGDKEYYIKDCKNVEIVNATVTAYDSSTVTACDSSTVTAYDSSTVTACDSSTVTAYGSSTVTAYDSSTVTAYDSSTVTACDSSTVTAYGSSTVTAYDSSTVTAYGSSTVTAYDSSTVTAYDSSTVVKPSWSSFKKSNLILSENATFKDCQAKIIYQSGGWELRSV